MRLAAIFSNGMVLQRDCAIPVWGWAEAGETVSVELAGRAARTTVGNDGRWRVSLPSLPAGGPHTLTVQGSTSFSVHDVLVGEVWLCSGQSNMEMALSQAANAAAEIAAADYPRIRLLTVSRQCLKKPSDDVSSRWGICTPKEASMFSAVGYFFGRELHQRLGVPIGLINSSWGGTAAQAWISRDGLFSDPDLGIYAEEVKRTVDVTDEQAQIEYEAARVKFLSQLPQDAGNRGFTEGWAERSYDDAAWNTMELPAYWTLCGHPTNGVFWFRLVVDLPADWTGKELLLSLGAVDKNDDTYFNGQHVGRMTWAENPLSWATPREYSIPAGLVKPGRNVIAVRALSNYTGGGLAGPGAAMELRLKGGGDAKPVPLAGIWRYRIEQDFGKVGGVAEPAPAMGQNIPTALYNGMIAPIIPYAMRGAIWYQGESNVNDPIRYRKLFPALIRDWRQRWRMDNFGFYFVQLANYGGHGGVTEYDDSAWAKLREAQSVTRALPNTGMAVAIDVGDPHDIHPANKQDVGLRLALNALAKTYGQPVVYSGPRFKSLQVEASALRLEFSNADGLHARGGELRSLAIAGGDRIFHLAAGRIDGTSVVACSPKVPNPVAARYGWSDCPTCTLYNAANLPAEPFRTDDW